MNLRPMTMADADFMLSLKNDPDTRKFAIASHEEISKENHYKYLEDNIQYFQVIEASITTEIYRNEFGNGAKGICGRAGVIRIQDNEISIWIQRDFRGKGIASYIIEQVSEKGMMATIVNTNIASMKAFIRAGFEPISYTPQILDGHYIFKK